MTAYKKLTFTNFGSSAKVSDIDDKYNLYCRQLDIIRQIKLRDFYIKEVLKQTELLHHSLKYKLTRPKKQLDENDFRNHEILYQMNEVLGHIRILYLNKHDNCSETDLARLSDEDYPTSYEEKINRLMPLIDELPGYGNPLVKNIFASLAICALLYFLAMTTLVIISATAPAAVPFMTLGFFLPSCVGLAGQLILTPEVGGVSTMIFMGLSLYNQNRGLADSVDKLVHPPQPRFVSSLGSKKDSSQDLEPQTTPSSN